jgi:hypothetical protein
MILADDIADIVVPCVIFIAFQITVLVRCITMPVLTNLDLAFWNHLLSGTNVQVCFLQQTAVEAFVYLSHVILLKLASSCTAKCCYVDSLGFVQVSIYFMRVRIKQKPGSVRGLRMIHIL